MMRRSLVPLIALFGLVLFPTTPAQETGGSTGGKPFYSQGLHGVDLSGLTDDQKEIALRVLNDSACDCGCGMNVAQCRVEDQNCPRSPSLARAIVDAVRRGGDEEAARKAYEAALGGEHRAPAKPSHAVQEIPVGDSPVRGPAAAPVTIVEFSDFQCPFWARAQPILDQVRELYPEQVRVVFKHLPLSIHPRARDAAIAAEAAALQGKFWEMHDILYLNPAAMERSDFVRFAGDLGLDVARFESDLASAEVAARVDADLAEAERVGASSTPTFYVNGQRLQSQQLASFRQAIERSLATTPAR